MNFVTVKRERDRKKWENTVIKGELHLFFVWLICEIEITDVATHYYIPSIPNSMYPSTKKPENFLLFTHCWLKYHDCDSHDNCSRFFVSDPHTYVCACLLLVCRGTHYFHTDLFAHLLFLFGEFFWIEVLVISSWSAGVSVAVECWWIFMSRIFWGFWGCVKWMPSFICSTFNILIK